MPNIDTSWDQRLAGYAAYSTAVLGLSDATVRNHGIYLRAFATWWDAARPGLAPGTASTADLAEFLVAEAARGLAARTRRAEAATLRRFYAWLILSGQATANPATALGVPRATPARPASTGRSRSRRSSPTRAGSTIVAVGSVRPSSRRCAIPGCVPASYAACDATTSTSPPDGPG